MWYKTGTINLIANNATVTGTGTSWADAKFGVMPGMILLAPDNKLYEVKQVNSNTSLTLNSNYAGSTASGQNYAIITTYEGDISQFSARFAAMLTFFQGSRNDTVNWFTGTGDMTFTKDDGTKLTVPTLAKIQSDSLSRSTTLDQNIASSVLFSKPIRLASTTTPEFTPTTQGAWVSWNRATTAAGGLAAATDFINNKGSGIGGFNWWNTNSTDTTLCAYLSPAGNFVAKGQLISTGDMLMNVSPSTANILIRFRDSGGVEKSAVYAQTDTGAMNIRWNGTANTASFRPDGFVALSNGLVLGNAFTTTEKVPDLGALPFVFRGGDRADLVHPNNANIATSNGFSVVSTATTGLASNVKYGVPVFSVNTRAGTAQFLNGLKVAGLEVIKSGEYGIGGVAKKLPLENTLSAIAELGTGKYVVWPGSNDMPIPSVAFALDWNYVAETTGGSGVLTATAVITAPSTYDVQYRNTLRNGVWQGWVKAWDTNNLVNPLRVGDYGLGGTTAITIADANAAGNNQFIRFNTNTPSSPSTTAAWAGISGGFNDNVRFQMVWGQGSTTNELRTRVRITDGTWSTWANLWHSTNTTIDANGFLKKASPIARLSSNPEKMPDEYLDGFTLSGLAAVNGEAAGVTAERVSVGVYKVTGSLGFALEGWNIEVPQDVNGNRLCFVATEVAEDGTIVVKVSKRRFDIDTAAIVAGEPMDIPEGRWIDLRLQMPPVEEVQSELEPESHEGEMANE